MASSFAAQAAWPRYFIASICNKTRYEPSFPENHPFLSGQSNDWGRQHLTLEGPGAHSEQIVKTAESTRILMGKVIRLEPGQSYKIPLTNLKYGDEYSLHQWKWTRPGEYTLTAAYVIGEVRYDAEPVKLTLVH